MPHISTLAPGDRVVYFGTDEDRKEPLHAVIARVCHEDTEDNNRPRLNLAVLLPSGQWTRRCGVQYADDGESRMGRWHELE